MLANITQLWWIDLLFFGAGGGGLVMWFKRQEGFGRGASPMQRSQIKTFKDDGRRLFKMNVEYKSEMRWSGGGGMRRR